MSPVRNGQPRLPMERDGHPVFLIAARRGIVEERRQLAIQIASAGADLDRALVDATVRAAPSTRRRVVSGASGPDSAAISDASL